MGKLIVVVGGQYGSEGKGALCAHLARMESRPLLGVRVAGPNAGHTAWGYPELVNDISGDGRREFKLQQIPVPAVVNRGSFVAIAAGSEIDPEILRRELDETGLSLARLCIDPQATVLEKHHQLTESKGRPHGEDGLTRSIGSTGKGVGAARANRLMREARTWGDFQQEESGWRLVKTGSVASLARNWLADGGTVMVEGTQGFGLGLHAGFYPFCTSSDCRAIDMLGMAGISPWSPEVESLEVWVTLRTFPIRVAGNSGPMFQETTWESVANAASRPELESGETTTVTKKLRRVGHWDPVLARGAVQANGGPGGPVKVALMFADYWWAGLAGKVALGGEPVWGGLARVEAELEQPISILGTGPDTVIDLRGD